MSSNLPTINDVYRCSNQQKIKDWLNGLMLSGEKNHALYNSLLRRRNELDEESMDPRFPKLNILREKYDRAVEAQTHIRDLLDIIHEIVETLGDDVATLEDDIRENKSMNENAKKAKLLDFINKQQEELEAFKTSLNLSTN